jgi:hypothetical protein
MVVDLMEVIDNPVNDVLFSAGLMPIVGSKSSSHPLTQEQEVVMNMAHADLCQQQWIEECAKNWAICTYGPCNIVQQDGMILRGNHPYKGHMCFTQTIKPMFLTVYINSATPLLQRVTYSNVSLLRHQFCFTLNGTEVNPKLAIKCMEKFVKFKPPPPHPHTPSLGPSLQSATHGCRTE